MPWEKALDMFATADETAHPIWMIFVFDFIGTQSLRRSSGAMITGEFVGLKSVLRRSSTETGFDAIWKLSFLASILGPPRKIIDDDALLDFLTRDTATTSDTILRFWVLGSYTMATEI
jgi:hypothetical protein